MSAQYDLTRIVESSFKKAVVGLATIAALGGVGCGSEAPGVTPIVAPDPRPGEDPTNGEPRQLDPELLENFYLETNQVRNEDSNAYRQVILLQTSGGPDQIVSLNDLPDIALLDYQVFADYLFGAAGPSSLSNPEKCPDSDKSLLTALQELYRKTGIEALNQPDNDVGAIEAGLQLEATLQALYTGTSKGIQFDAANPVVGGYSVNGTPFIAIPILYDSANPTLMVACGDCLPQSTPAPGSTYQAYSRLPTDKMADAVECMKGLANKGF